MLETNCWVHGGAVVENQYGRLLFDRQKPLIRSICTAESAVQCCKAVAVAANLQRNLTILCAAFDMWHLRPIAGFMEVL
jgi:hypothetical protein